MGKLEMVVHACAVIYLQSVTCFKNVFLLVALSLTHLFVLPLSFHCQQQWVCPHGHATLSIDRLAVARNMLPKWNYCGICAFENGLLLRS